MAVRRALKVEACGNSRNLQNLYIYFKKVAFNVVIYRDESFYRKT